MVKFSTIRSLPLGVLLFSATLTVDAYIQVNYYWDGGCTDYALDIPMPPEQEIYNYAYTNTNSANIANCDYYWCDCTFYAGPDGTGESWYVSSPSPSTAGNGNCASNWGGGFQSFICSYGPTSAP
jgi:hypothetical protein